MKTLRTIDYQKTLLEDLKNPSEAAGYLNAALAEGDSEYLLVALRNVAEAQGGLKKISLKSKLNLQSLYRMLSKTGNPELQSLEMLLEAMGLQIAIQPVPNVRTRQVLKATDASKGLVRAKNAKAMFVKLGV